MLQVVLTVNQPFEQFVVSPMSDCVHSVVADGVLMCRLPVSLFLCFSVSCCDVAAVCLCASLSVSPR